MTFVSKSNVAGTKKNGRLFKISNRESHVICATQFSFNYIYLLSKIKLKIMK